MKRDHGPLVEGTASFHTTRWAIVMRAAQSQAADGEQSAFAELISLSWYPFCIFVRRRWCSPEGAPDLTEGRFVQVLAHRALTRVHQLKGDFAKRLELRAGEIKILALLREEVGCTLSDFSAIDEEIHALCDALVAAKGRLSP